MIHNLALFDRLKGTKKMGCDLQSLASIADEHGSVFWRYVKNGMAAEVIALRGIQPGEEVAHSCKM